MSLPRTLHAGLGPIGMQILRASVDEATSQPVAAVDINPQLVGVDLGRAADRPGVGEITITDDLERALGDTQADCVVLATGSRIPDIAPQVLAAVAVGSNVVSTCEELTWPWLRHPGPADEIDRAARDSGVTVVGTGINPGFLLDLLPLLLCRPCQSVRKITARRIVDVSLRRAQLQKKVGSGLEPEAYRELAAREKVGHVGLAESAALLASGLGWRFDGFRQTSKPVIAEHRTGTEHFDIAPGQVMGSHQECRIDAEGGKVVELICHMAHGEPDPRDEVIVDADPPVHMRIEGGIFGDTATAGCTVNILKQVVRARPGLLTVKDLPVA